MSLVPTFSLFFQPYQESCSISSPHHHNKQYIPLKAQTVSNSFTYIFPVRSFCLNILRNPEVFELMDDALEFSPKIIIVGLYFGNDIYDAYRVVYVSHTSRRYLTMQDNKLSHELSKDTIFLEYKKHADAEMKYLNPPLWRLGDWLLGNSYFFSFIYRFVMRGIFKKSSVVDVSFIRSKAWAEAYPEYGVVYESESIRTVFTPAYRLLALNLQDPRISDGLRISKEALIGMKKKVENKDVFLIILLIPTKELVYADAVPSERMNKNFRLLIEMEARVREEILKFCDDNKIYYIDALPALKNSREKNIYPTSADGHPTVQGNFVIAKAVYDKLLELGAIDY